MGMKQGNASIQLLARSLDKATGKLLENNKSPSRKTGELDNRGSHFFLGLYWAQELASQTEDAELAARFAPFAEKLANSETQVLAELAEIQGVPAKIEGYYHAERAMVKEVMRASPTLNALLAEMAG